MRGEQLEVLRGRSPPFVDGLILVADGDHWEAIVEYGRQQGALCRVGVLVLVEDHGAISTLDLRGEFRIPPGDSGRECD